MSSAVNDLQRAIVDGQQSLIQLLRKTKLIAAKLGLEDMEKWVDYELKGYPDNVAVPQYRHFVTTHIEIRNPVRGWGFAGNLAKKIRAPQPITEIEALTKQETALINLDQNQNLPVNDTLGSGMARNWPQRIVIMGGEFKQILEAVTNELVQWTIELEKRGIKGENMDFNEHEKKTAGHMIFNIGTVHGAVGNVTNSHVTFYDNKTINQLFAEKNVPKQDRRELEDILDELKTAQPAKKKTLVARAEELIVKHKDALGATAEIIAKSIKAALE